MSLQGQGGRGDVTDKTVLVCVCVCACAHVCTFLLTFGQTVYQGLLAAPRWPLIHPQHNDSSEEQKEANHYIKTDCIRLRRNVCPCVCVRGVCSQAHVFACVHVHERLCSQYSE